MGPEPGREGVGVDGVWDRSRLTRDPPDLSKTHLHDLKARLSRPPVQVK